MMFTLLPVYITEKKKVIANYMFKPTKCFRIEKKKMPNTIFNLIKENNLLGIGFPFCGANLFLRNTKALLNIIYYHIIGASFV